MRKKKTKTFKQLFAWGGLTTPEEALNEHKLILEKAIAEGESNDISAGIDLGNELLKTGVSIFSKVKGAKAGQSGEGDFDMESLQETDFEEAERLNQFGYAFGGEVEEDMEQGAEEEEEVETEEEESKIPVEVEGGEVVEEPGKEPVEVEGERHEQGGVDADLDAGTKIFSDRLRGADGKTMAERKIAREKRIAALQKKLDADPHNPNLKKTVRVSLQALQQIEQKDLAYMESMRGKQKNIQQSISEDTRQKFSGGTAWLSPPTDEEDLNAKALKFSTLLPTETKSDEGYIDEYFTGIDGVLSALDKPSGQIVTEGGSNSEEKSSEKKGGFLDYLSGLVGEDTKKLGETLWNNRGDILSGIGAYKALNDGKKTLQKTMADQTTNPNYFKDYGKTAETMYDELFSTIDVGKDSQIADLEASRRVAMQGNRKSSRGINTSRALDIATNVDYEKAKQDVNRNYLASKLGLKEGKINLIQQNEARRLEGAKEADIANRQDMAAYYSNLMYMQAMEAVNLQALGKNLNEVRKENTKVDIANSTSKHYTADKETGKIDYVKNKSQKKTVEPFEKPRKVKPKK